MYGKVDKIQPGKRLFPNWRHSLFKIVVMFRPKTNNIVSAKKIPWYCGRDHSSSAVVFRISVGTRTFIQHGYRCVASARMTKRGGGGSSDYSYCAKRSYTAALRVAASPGPRGDIIQVPPVVKLRHSKVVVSRQYPRKKPVVACTRPGIALLFVFSSGEDSLEKCVWMACFVVAVVPDSVAVVVCRSRPSGRVGT